MATRYTNSSVLISTTDEAGLKDIIDRRGLKSVSHYNTANLKYPTIEEINNFSITKHIWSSGDKYWKLSATYYGDPKYWWLIAWYNHKPIEAMLNIGDVLEIPQPLGDVLGVVG